MTKRSMRLEEQTATARAVNYSSTRISQTVAGSLVIPSQSSSQLYVPSPTEQKIFYYYNHGFRRPSQVSDDDMLINFGFTPEEYRSALNNLTAHRLVED